MITREKLAVALPSNKNVDEWLLPLNEILPQYDITSDLRVDLFLAQTGHESNDYRTLFENLNYSARGLLATFPKYFNAKSANEYARKPVMIANRVYGGRMGNNTEDDGWIFRGCGLIQLTGRDNHTRYGETIGMTAEEARLYIENTTRGKVEAACWFWKENNLNSYADSENVIGASRVINGGTKGLQDRIDRYVRLRRLAVGSTYPNVRIYKYGSRGENVKSIQAKLGLKADGIFGQATEEAVIKFQKANGLVSDGVVGPATMKKLGL